MKEFFGALSLIIVSVAFIAYYQALWRGTAKPHLFSWIPWTLTTGVGFWASWSHGGGIGAWPFALQTLGCGVVLVYALFLGEKHITTLDRVALAGSLVAFFLYIFTKNSALSVILAASVDTIGFIPTFRKSFAKPWEEPVFTYALSGLSWALSIAALSMYSFETTFYASILTIANLAFVAFALSRRRVLKNRQSST